MLADRIYNEYQNLVPHLYLTNPLSVDLHTYSLGAPHIKQLIAHIKQQIVYFLNSSNLIVNIMLQTIIIMTTIFSNVTLIYFDYLRNAEDIICLLNCLN